MDHVDFRARTVPGFADTATKDVSGVAHHRARLRLNVAGLRVEPFVVDPGALGRRPFQNLLGEMAPVDVLEACNFTSDQVGIDAVRRNRVVGGAGEDLEVCVPEVGAGISGNAGKRPQLPPGGR